MRDQIPAATAAVAPLPDRLRVPLSDHAGSPALPCVATGAKVLAGETIGRAVGALSAHVHAPTSGEVVLIGRGAAGSGLGSEYVEIAADHFDRPHPEIADRGEAPPESEWEALLESGGILLRDRSRAPLAALLPRFRALPEKTLVVSLLERDVIGRNVESILAVSAEPVARAAAALRRLVGFPRAFVCHLGRFGTETAERLAGHGFLPVLLPDAYPGGLSPILARVATGRDLLGRNLPFESDILVVCAETLLALADRLFRRMPVIESRVSVAGFGVARPQVVRARVGTPLSVLVDHCGGFVGSVGKIVVNGLFTGEAITDLSRPVTKTTRSLAVLPRAASRRARPTPCIGCGRCLDACPARLEPLFLEQVIDARDEELADRLRVRACILCGMCSYVCPAHRPLAEKIATARAARGRAGGIA